jgi:arsenite methyltransferase
MSNDHDTRDQVREGYAEIAERGGTCCSPDDGNGAGGCCGPSVKSNISAEDLATQIGYDADQITQLPDGANMGLSCGNPTAIAALQPGQVVVDLGSGGGFDAFLAGPKVGAEGRVIGIDMTPQMLAKARKNIEHYHATSGLDNVEFRLGEIEHLPLADESVDVIISNCVINLSPDKPQVWREIARVLKPGGRVAASDMALFKPLPEAVKDKVSTLVGCVAGAVLVDEYEQMITDAGLTDTKLTPKPEYVAALESMGDPLYEEIKADLPAGASCGDYITSIDVQATKS